MKRALAVSGFTMLCTLLVFCNIKDDLTMSVAIIASLVVLFIFLLIKPIRRNRTLPTAALSFLIALLLLFVNNSMYYKNAILYNNKEITISGTLSSLPYEKNGNSYYIIKTDTINGNNEKLNIRISSKSPVDIQPTDKVTVTIKAFLLGTIDDDILNYYKTKDLFLGGYALSDYNIEKDKVFTLSSQLLKLQENMINSIMNILPNDYGAVTAGLVIGDKVNLSKSASNAFLACGVTHLFVVSGLHMSMWSMLFYRFSKKFKLSNKSASLVSIAFCLFFIILTGCTPSVLRSGIMMIVIYLSNIFNREAEAFNSIGLSLIVMFFLNPYNAVSISLWLSLLATMGILLLFNPINNFINKPIRKCKYTFVSKLYKSISSVIAISISVSILTLPVYLLELKAISTLQILSNLIMVSLGSLCMAVGGIASIFVISGLKFIGTPLMLFCGLIAKLLLKAAYFLSSYRYSLVPIYSNYSKIVLAISALVLAFILIKNITNKKVIKTTAIFLATTFITVNLAVISVNHNLLQLSVANVGNGMSVIMKYKGQTAVVGCGGDYFAEGSICDIIKSYASTTVDYLILPDSSKTCTSEANDIINSYNVKNLYLSEKNQLNKYSFNGKVNYTDKSVISISDGELIIAVEDSANCHVVQIIYYDFKAIITFDSYNNIPNASGNLLISRSGLPNGFKVSDFNLIVVSSDNNDNIWQREFAENICSTADNGSISFIIKPNGTFTNWRAT